MTFGRWLLVHSFSIFLVGLLLAGYLYRDELRLQQAYDQLLSLSPGAAILPGTDQDSAHSQPPDSEAIAEAEAPQDAGTVSDQAATEPGISSGKAPSNDMLVSKPTVSEPVVVQDDLLLNARQAFWNKDFAAAIEGYSQLIRREPENPDLLGELGNVYYAMNDYPRAARFYYQAAELLIEQGEVNRARQMVAPVTAMQRELGDRLNQRLNN